MATAVCDARCAGYYVEWWKRGREGVGRMDGREEELDRSLALADVSHAQSRGEKYTWTYKPVQGLKGGSAEAGFRVVAFRGPSLW